MQNALTSAEKVDWLRGAVTFSDLMIRHRISHQELATELDIRMPEFVVSVRSAFDSVWPVHDAERIGQAKDAYDSGASEMATGRVGKNFVLYSFPRKFRAVRPVYFARDYLD